MTQETSLRGGTEDKSATYAANSPFDHMWRQKRPHNDLPDLGTARGDSVRKWLEGLHSDGPSSLWDPFVGDPPMSRVG